MAQQWGREVGCESVHGHEQEGVHNVGYTCAGEGGCGGVCEAGGGRPFRKWSCGAVGCPKGGCTGSRGGEGCPQVGHTTQGFNLHSEESGLSQGGEVLEVREQAVQACGAWGRVQDRQLWECARLGA